MTIDLSLLDDGFHMEAENATGQTVTIDNSPEEERSDQGMSPMQLTATSLAGCSSIDVLTILRKGRHEVKTYRVRVDAERRSEPLPRVFEDIHLHFEVEGDIPPKALRRAIDLSLGTYCSVSKMLEKTATITYTFTLNGEDYAEGSDE